MNLKDSVEQVADFLWDLVTSDPGDSVQRFNADPSQYLADHGHEGLTADDLDAAFGRLADRLPADQFAQVMPMRAATQSLGPMGGGSGLGGGGVGWAAGSGSNASMAAHMAVAPRSQPQVVRHVHEQRVTQVRETSAQPQAARHPGAPQRHQQLRAGRRHHRRQPHDHRDPRPGRRRLRPAHRHPHGRRHQGWRGHRGRRRGLRHQHRQEQRDPGRRRRRARGLDRGQRQHPGERLRGGCALGPGQRHQRQR